MCPRTFSQANNEGCGVDVSRDCCWYSNSSFVLIPVIRLENAAAVPDVDFKFEFTYLCPVIVR